MVDLFAIAIMASQESKIVCAIRKGEVASFLSLINDKSHQPIMDVFELMLSAMGGQR